MSEMTIPINSKNEEVLLNFEYIAIVDLKALDSALLKIKEFLTEEQLLDLKNNYQFDILPLDIGKPKVIP